ncbi:MAG: 3-isopropylmalate dehydratase small subunit [Bacteroidaceae bacterium]|nr:3-isopropylmalate dehydratase small subunit [Bacteroidaceae bacterium]
MRQKFTTLRSTVVPLPIENIDTDQIIPARFLKATTREGFGENLFRDWRYDKEGNPKADFVMNSSIYKGEILVAGKNFGCGSSREHAAWAIDGAGFRAVVSSFFADIFRNNALNNGLLPVVVSEKMLAEIFATAEKDADMQLDIDLPTQTIKILGTGVKESFEIAPYKKQCLMSGYDDVDFLVSIRSEIETFEKR